jgi:hypothetical protein
MFFRSIWTPYQMTCSLNPLQYSKTDKGVYAMKAYGGVEGKLHPGQRNSAEWSVSKLGRPNLPQKDFGIR